VLKWHFSNREANHVGILNWRAVVQGILAAAARAGVKDRMAKAHDNEIIAVYREKRTIRPI